MTQQEFKERKRIMDLGDNATWEEIDSIDWTDEDAEFEYDAILATTGDPK